MSVEKLKAPLAAIDDYFQVSKRYRNSWEYLDLLEFVGRFTEYSLFNSVLLHIQDPLVSVALTPRDWFSQFRRIPKAEAQPLIVLSPGKPVDLLFDLKETEGQAIPPELLEEEEPIWKIHPKDLRRILHNMAIHGIAVGVSKGGNIGDGKAMRLSEELRTRLKIPEDEPHFYLVALTKGLPLKERYLVIVQELARILCGHFGVDEKAWWYDRRGASAEVKLIEAESVAYLVYRRMGFGYDAQTCLDAYRGGENHEMPLISLHTVLGAANYILDMGKSNWKKPKKKPPKR